MPDRVSCGTSRSERSVVAIAAMVAGGRSDLPVAGLLVVREPVVRDRLPDRRVVQVLAVRRPDARVTVEGAEANAFAVALVRIEAPQRRAAARAEGLREAALGRPLGDEVLAMH